ncbi:MAG: hypothetical protein LBT59_26545 [Clostridiales bacterium]|jgi:tetratricopeptide (TPR) repeat protein|nr:hypothetical protein [Clostridiales bacterium]
MGENDIMIKLAGCIVKAGNFLNKREYADALAEFDVAEEILADYEDDPNALAVKAILKEERASVYRRFERKEEADQLSVEAIGIRDRLVYDDELERNTGYVALATSMVQLEKFEQALEYADKVADFFTFEMGLAAASNLLKLGEIYMNLPDKRYKKAKKAYTKSRNIYWLHLPEYSRTVFQIQYKLADIAHEYEHDDAKAIAECQMAWMLAESMGIENCDIDELIQIAMSAFRTFATTNKERFEWCDRSLLVCGRIIDLGDADYGVVAFYMGGNISAFLGTGVLNPSVKIERALRSIAIAKNSSKDEDGYAMMKLLAGVALAQLGKSAENSEKSVRLIKSAVKQLKETGSVELGAALVAIGEAYIAEHFFAQEAYESAAKWYQLAKNDMIASEFSHRDKYIKIYSDKLAECSKRN